MALMVLKQESCGISELIPTNWPAKHKDIYYLACPDCYLIPIKRLVKSQVIFYCFVLIVMLVCWQQVFVLRFVQSINHCDYIEVLITMKEPHGVDCMTRRRSLCKPFLCCLFGNIHLSSTSSMAMEYFRFYLQWGWCECQWPKTCC